MEKACNVDLFFSDYIVNIFLNQVGICIFIDDSDYGIF